MAALVAGAGARTLVDERREDVGAVFLLDGHRAVVEGGGGSGERGLAAFGTSLGALAGGGHAGVEGGELVHHALVLLLLVCVDGLSVLAEVVEARELLAAVAGEGAFAGVFPGREWERVRGWIRGRERDVPDVPGEVFAPAEDHPALAIAPALERLGGSGAVALVDACSDGRERGRGLDDGGHVVVGEGVCGMGVVVVVAVVHVGQLLRGLLAVHWPVESGWCCNLKGA